VPYSDHLAILEAMIGRHSDAVVFELRAGCPQDLGVLHLVRRALPHVPLIVVADDDSLELQRRVQALKPTYYAVRPLESAEIVEALTDALGRRSPHRH
jgi:DNA-binding NarL/FixJ family response regulator